MAKRLSFNDWSWALSMRIDALYGDREIPTYDYKSAWKTGKTPTDVTDEMFEGKR